jgi:hypothetical protein
MIAAHEQDPHACAYNDFALVRLDPSDARLVNPSLPAWGGPNGVAPSARGRSVYSYGNSGLRQGVRRLSPKTGVVIFEESAGWSYTVFTATPGIPGDSGSAVLDAKGGALGILVTINSVPPGANGVTSLERAMRYARYHGMPNLALANGTAPFNTRPVGRYSRGMLSLN